MEPINKGTEDLSHETISMALEEQDIFINSYSMLSNGGRLYIDPSGPEYCTPETRTAEEAVHRMFDGDEIILKMFDSLRKKEIIEGYQVNRRVVDHNRSSRGIHLNTMTNGNLFSYSERVLNSLAALNAVKGAIFGSGGLLLNKIGETDYHHSPRLSITNEISSNYSNYWRRPLVRTPFKDDGCYKRIETVSTDALNLAWPIRANLVITNALVHMLEMGIDDLPYLKNPIYAARQVGRHGNETRFNVGNMNDKHGKLKIIRPVDLIEEVSVRALELGGKVEFIDDETNQVLQEIINTIDLLRIDPESVANRVESVARWIAISKKMEKLKVDINSEKICRFDYYWDLLGGGKPDTFSNGLAESLRKKNISGWHGFSKRYEAKETNKRITTPPTDTRANRRGYLVKQYRGLNESTWERIHSGGMNYEYQSPVLNEKV